MRILISLFIMSTLSISTAFGQIREKEVYPEQVSINHNEAVKKFSKGFVSNYWNGGDLGSNFNKIANMNILGTDNIALLSQEGYNLMGEINIQGDYNDASLYQTGTDLMSILNIEGSHNEFNMDQYGSGLSNLVNIYGSGLQFDARHNSYGFELKQQSTGSIPFTIQQSGRSIPITIKNY